MATCVSELFCRLPSLPMAAGAFDSSGAITVLAALIISLLVVVRVWKFSRRLLRDTSPVLAIVDRIIEQHRPALLAQKRRKVYADAYGVERREQWEQEIEYFFHEFVSPALSVELPQHLIRREARRAATFVAETNGRPRDGVGMSDLDALRFVAVRWVDARVAESESGSPPAFDQSMGATEYECYCSDQLRAAGWEVRRCGGAGDQGADIVARKAGTTAVIQCKRYSQAVNNAAVQQVHAARSIYGATLAVVVSNAEFTRGARSAANATQVSLLHHAQLSCLQPNGTIAEPPRRSLGDAPRSGHVSSTLPLLWQLRWSGALKLPSPAFAFARHPGPARLVSRRRPKTLLPTLEMQALYGAIVIAGVIGICAFIASESSAVDRAKSQPRRPIMSPVASASAGPASTEPLAGEVDQRRQTRIPPEPTSPPAAPSFTPVTASVVDRTTINTSDDLRAAIENAVRHKGRAMDLQQVRLGPEIQVAFVLNDQHVSYPAARRMFYDLAAILQIVGLAHVQDCSEVRVLGLMRDEKGAAIRADPVLDATFSLNKIRAMNWSSTDVSDLPSAANRCQVQAQMQSAAKYIHPAFRAAEDYRYGFRQRD